MLISNSEVRRTFSVCKTKRMVTVEQFLSDFFFSIFFPSVSHSFIAWPQEGLALLSPFRKKVLK